MRIERLHREAAFCLVLGGFVPEHLLPALRDRAAGKPPTNPIAASLSPEQAQAILSRSGR